MRNKAISINLIGRKKTFVDKFINWSLTIGRLIIIITELIALGTFLYRFDLDRKLIDLSDEITKKQAIVRYLKANEDKYRNLQGRLSIASKFIDNSTNHIKIFNDIITMAPNDLTFKTISSTGDGIKIDSSLRSVSSLAKYIQSIKDYPQVQSVSLDKIENKTSNSTINVSLSITLKTQAQQNNTNLNKL